MITSFYISIYHEVYSNFLDTLENIISKHISPKIVTIRPRDKAFMNNKKKRNKIHYKAKHTNNPNHWQQYRNLRNVVIEEKRISGIISIKNIESQINKSIPPGKWWRIVKSLAKKPITTTSTQIRGQHHLPPH